MNLAKRYIKIFFLWFGGMSIIGLFLAFAGVGQGGASAIFLFIFMGLGFIGGAIHVIIISIFQGTTIQKIVIPTIFLLLPSFFITILIVA